jgi:hypothetical protein
MYWNTSKLLVDDLIGVYSTFERTYFLNRGRVCSGDPSKMINGKTHCDIFF